MRRNKLQICNRRSLTSNSRIPNNAIPGWQCGYCGKTMPFEPLRGQQKSSVCLQCMDVFCVECTILDRCGHRHRLLTLPVQRPPSDYGLVTCSNCQTRCVLALYSGLWCSDCTRYFYCGNCFDTLRKSQGRNSNQVLHHNGCIRRAGYVLYLNKF